MLAYARHLLMLMLWQRPATIIACAAVLGALGLIAGACGSALVGQRREAHKLMARDWPQALTFLLFCLADWALLWALPTLRLSFAPAITPPLFLSISVRLLVFWGLLGATLLARCRGRRRGIEGPARAVTVLFLAANLGLSAIQVDAYVIEPLLVETTELSLAFDDLDPNAPPVRMVHLSDVHVERSSYREAMVVRRVNALQPDLIVLTGDYLNLSYLSDPTSAAHFRQFAAQLEAPYGIYAVRGSVEPTPESMRRLVEGTNVVWLEQEAVTVNVRGQPVTLVGVATSSRHALDTARLKEAMDGIPGEAFTVLLYHLPDLIHRAAGQQVDLVLSGHTHGGQVRLPFYGALVTNSRYGRQYAAGLFEEGPTTMYVSRGLGFEGGDLPRVRLLCRPEIVSLELRGKDPAP